MFARDVEVLLARLCLLAVAFLGLSPSQGLVLCFEPDGRVALEIPGASSTCEPRAGSCCEDDEAERVVLRSTCCDCTDVPIASTDEVTVVHAPDPARYVEAPLAVELSNQAAPVAFASHERWRRVDAPPGPPGILAHVRAIELRL